jgi:hypothetical protein
VSAVNFQEFHWRNFLRDKLVIPIRHRWNSRSSR